MRGLGNKVDKALSSVELSLEEASFAVLSPR